MDHQKTNKVFFEARIQIIGTYSEKSKTFRWGWSNRFVPLECKRTSLKIMNFGKSNKIDMLQQPKVKGENMGHIFTALGMELSNGRGYYIIPGTKVYPDIFLIFTKCKKVNLNYEDIKKKNTNNKRRNTKKMKNLMEKPYKKMVIDGKLKNNLFNNSASSSYLNKKKPKKNKKSKKVKK